MGKRGSTSLQLQSSFASAFWTRHEFFHTKKNKFCLINTRQQIGVRAEVKKKSLPNDQGPSPTLASELTEDATLELAPGLCSFSAL